MRIIISGGGTGGHVFPAIAIADAIKKKHPEAEIRFVGAKGKLEMEKVPKAGYPIDGLWISGFQRKLTWQLFSFPIKLISSLWKARQIIRKFRPDVAVGVGGYASGPTLQMAERAGVPCLLQEQNSYAGVTNRILAGKASRICVAYEGMEKYFPATRLVLTGNPVRDAIRNSVATREAAGTYFEVNPNRKTVLVFGGSLGAKSINEAIAAQTELWQQHPEVQLIWQVGSLYWDQYQQAPMAQLENVKALPFIDRMDLAYELADVVVGRAGALTISELCLVGKPTILIPSPNVAEDHQTKNARALEEKDAAILLPDSEAKARILTLALDILGDANRQSRLVKNIQALGIPDADERIAAEVLRLISGKK
ncbi:MAG: undecaprenyldiphospho-muramoylpentapeptide beta-N-acetylglucosaminyltransferase [Saprospiraceae bacterium]|nr:undecaprenyldiphospho-muramoylpentapeptide beta-N-acetylglucosaminyltransferase [Saprospiraceae bacterium]